MSDVAPPVPQGYAPVPNKPQKGWFGRNWLWFIPVIIILPIILCCGGCSLLGYFTVQKGMEELKNFPGYKNSVAAMEANTDVTDALGTPIEVAGLIAAASTGNPAEISESEIDISYPITGPKGSGLLIIDAELDSNGQWVWRTLTVHIDATGEDIDLLGSSGITPDSLIDLESLIPENLEDITPGSEGIDE